MTSPSSRRVTSAEISPIPYVGHQRLATGLAARERAEITLDRGQLDLEQLDHLQRHTDPLTRVDRELQTGEELPVSERA